MALVLVLSLTSCGEKAISQEPSGSGSSQEKAQISKQISEVSPPAAIQELRQTLEVYQPQVAIATPKPDEILQDNTVTVRLLVKDLPLFKDQQLDLGPHLNVIVDNEPLGAVYDQNQPLVLPDLSPGTHTLRVFASYPWDESFKNEGAYAETTFHIFTKTDDNNPDPAKPLLTYSSPQGKYGAQPILLDFYLTNAPLHLVAQDNPQDEIADWRIRCTINGESFVLDRWQALYLKGFKPGKNWVKLEFLDEQGNPVKNVFNSTVRVITYEPKGKDTLSKIIRGELSADQVRTIVDPNYTAKIPETSPTPTPTLEKSPETQPIPTVESTPSQPPTLPEVTKSPSPEKTVQPQPEVTPKPESTTLPEKVTPQPEEKPRVRGYFNRRRKGLIPTPQETAEPTPTLPPTLPEIINESPAPKTTAQPQLEVTPKPESTALPEKEATQPEKPRVKGYFNRRRKGLIPTPQETAEPTPTLPPTLPEIIIESPSPEITAEPQPEVTPKIPSPLPETTVEPQLEVTPKPESTILPEKIAPDPEKPELKRYFNPNQYPNAAPSPTLPLTLPEITESPAPEAPKTTSQSQQQEKPAIPNAAGQTQTVP